MNQPRLLDNAAEHRFELHEDGAVAGFAEYRINDGAMRFTHTEVDTAREGQGLGSALAAFALDEARSRGLRVVPACRFIAAFMQRHPQYQDLLDEDTRRDFDL